MSLATGSIAGRVFDAGGNPVAGATVAIASSSQPHRDIAAITTGDGVFRLGGLRPGAYVLEGRHGTSRGGAHVKVGVGVPTDVEIRLA